ncbi:ribosome biogenesis GTP-binding protein YihA/YsxC [uncultured Eubacterium sp.]|uniref:ribosome biogenesis GTP-binding protein YihA/YsxC n=1 Tax=uncultured Eubacterium sp. TaxID=165185 RepID=UPI0025FBE788|nr:ribosome biogenesis GTP-binding protein YihA/YsxC [uncultured Eubacterium sp.]MDD5838339.1 ribosome biogenesis GTP-binding protein YihA/YsxC [Eubacteriales bacterium]
MNYNKAEFEKAFGISSQLPQSTSPEIAFSGRSNVGKSSLLNKLFNRKSLARVSSVPGKTITINFYNVDDCKFVDLPGYGYAKLSKTERDRFGELMEGYFQSGRNIKLVVQLVDMRHKPSQDDFGMIDFMQQMNIPFIIACTKADKLKVKEFQKREREIKQELNMVDEGLIVPFSSQTGLGLDNIKMLIEKSLEQ